MDSKNLFSSKGSWIKNLLDTLDLKISGHIVRQGKCSVCLTGGNSAAELYKAWGASTNFKKLKNVTFFLGDERFGVDHKSSGSNRYLVNSTLFADGIPSGCTFVAPEDSLEIHKMAQNYSALFPKSLDILLLSIGIDGHVAGLFPKSADILGMGSGYAATKAPLNIYPERLSITPKTIASSKDIIVMCIGQQKKNLYNDISNSSGSIVDCPARLVLNHTWIFEH